MPAHNLIKATPIKAEVQQFKNYFVEQWLENDEIKKDLN
jgi:hypothetical protein